MRKVNGAILIGMAAAAAAGSAMGFTPAPDSLVALPFTGEYTLAPIALHLDVAGVLRLSFLPVLLTLVLMSFLDTLGTLVGVGAAGGMLDEDGNFPQVEKPMLVDALACVFASLVGSSTSGAYIESAAGIREGARTGLAAVVTGLLFLASLFLLPLAGPLQQSGYARTGARGRWHADARVRPEDRLRRPDRGAPGVCASRSWCSPTASNGLTAGLVLYPAARSRPPRARLSRGSVALALSA